ncbi:hypothetical protein MKX01_027781 [Papaver californicum]|nr:hypothetical protein MKX01_027781 [Papaver californicum]
MYFMRDLKLNKNYLSTWTLMGHEYVEMKNIRAAVYAYRKAMDINPCVIVPGMFGQAYEMMCMPIYALYYFHKSCIQVTLGCGLPWLNVMRLNSFTCLRGNITASRARTL